MEKPALFLKFPIVVPTCIIPLVFAVPLVTTLNEFRLIHPILEGKRTRMAPRKAILTSRGVTTRPAGKTPALIGLRVPIDNMAKSTINDKTTSASTRPSPPGHQQKPATCPYGYSYSMYSRG